MKQAQSPAGKSFRSFFFGGLLPVIAFTLIEDHYGTWWGLIAGLAFGAGEIIFELYKYRKVEKLTLIGNGLLIFMGAISLYTNDGIWFKLQPAIFEAFFALALWIGLIFKKNILLILAKSQGQEYPPMMQPFMNGMCFRLGLFFAAQAALATWAALYWSTEAWALLKGVGVTLSLIIYMIIEVIGIRIRLSSVNKNQNRHPEL